MFLPITEDWFAVNSAFRILATHNIGRDFAARPTMQRAHDFDLLIADTVGAQVCWRFHRNEAKKLEQMVLHHVAQCASGFVKAGTRANPECFRRCDLHTIDVVRVPQR